jgi:hypothetical protein
LRRAKADRWRPALAHKLVDSRRGGRLEDGKRCRVALDVRSFEDDELWCIGWMRSAEGRQRTSWTREPAIGPAA